MVWQSRTMGADADGGNENQTAPTAIKLIFVIQ